MRLVRGLIFLILLSLATVSKGQTVSAQSMLSSKEFLSLDESAQLQVLKTIQDILIELELNPEAYSRLNFKFVDWFLPSASAQRGIPGTVYPFYPGQELKSAQNVVDRIKGKVSRNERISPEDLKQLQLAVTSLVGEIRINGDMGALDKRAEALRAFRQTQEYFTSSKYPDRINKDVQEYINAQGRIIERVLKEPTGTLRERSDAPNHTRPRKTQSQNPRPNLESNPVPSRIPRQPAPPSIRSSEKNPAPTSAKNSRVSEPATPQETKTGSNSGSDDSRWSFSGCILGGFALTEDVCKVPKELPQDFLKQQKTLDPKDFVCQNELALCNPLIFGYDCATPNPDGFCPESQKPICLAPKLSLTKDCRNRSASPSHMKRALDLIKKEPKLFDQFSKNFELICDESQVDKNRFVYFKIDGALRRNSDHIRQDLIQTCRAAKIRLDDIKKSLILTPEASAKPESTGQGKK